VTSSGYVAKDFAFILQAGYTEVLLYVEMFDMSKLYYQKSFEFKNYMRPGFQVAKRLNQLLE